MSYTDYDFPHTSLYQSDLREILAQVDKLTKIVENFVTVEKVTFADPILWDISRQYSKNTIVLSPSGDAYLSKDAVPKGVQLNDEDYWQEIFNFADYVRTANENLTINVEQNTTRSEHPYHVDDWLLWDDVLYKVIAEIAVDDLLIVDTNVEHFTVEDFIKAWIRWANATIQQYKDDIDASELAYRQQLAGDIASTTASLQAQLDAVIAGATVDSEVIDARVGANSHVYNTLGDAIRTQIRNLGYNVINELNLLTTAQMVVGHYYDTQDTAFSSYNYYIVPVTSGRTYIIGAGYRFISKAGAIISNGSTNTDYVYTADFTGDIYITYRNILSDTFFGSNRFCCEVSAGQEGKRWFNKQNYAKSILDNPYNLLIDSIFVPDSYFDGSNVGYASTDYFIVNVQNGKSYTIAPGTRMIYKYDGTAISTAIDYNEYVYVADYDGPLYVTFTKAASPSYYMAETANISLARGCFGRNILSQKPNNNEFAAPSMKLVDTIAPISHLYRKTILNLGDSIAEDRTGSRSYAYQLQDIYGAVVSRDEAKSGATLSYNPDDQGILDSIYNQVVTTTTTFPDANYDIILIDGGTNDYGLNRPVGSIVKTGNAYQPADYTTAFDEKTVLGAMEAIFQMLRATYTNAIIVFVTPHKNARCNTYYYQIMDGLREVCYKWSIPVADIDKYGQLNTRIPAYQTTIYSDGGTHPNTLGTKIFYVPTIVQKLMQFFTN